MMKGLVFFIPLISVFTAIHLAGVAYSQGSAQVVITWQANNYYPSDFRGKAMATPNTPLSVSAEVVKDNALLDLRGVIFVWYADEQFLTRSEGQKEILLTVKKPVGGSYFVRVIIQIGSEIFESSITIPITPREVTLDIPYPNQTAAAGEIALQAVPYFFNITSLQDLGFSWLIDDKYVENLGDNQVRLTISAAEPFVERAIQIVSTIRNKTNPLEFVSTRGKLSVY